MEQQNPKTIEQYLSEKNTEAFVDFSDGVDIPDSEIHGRIIDLVRRLRLINKTTEMSISSGNTKVSVFYDADEERIDIDISKNRIEGHIFFKEGGIIDTGGIPLKVDPKSNKWVINHSQTWDN